MDPDIDPCKIAVPDAVGDDLRARLRRTRWPEAEPVADGSQGAALVWTQAVCRDWAGGCDCRAREALLNRQAQYTTRIGGLDIHFRTVRSPHAQARPLLMTRGWPGSMVEFQKVMDPLTDPTAHGGDADDAFHRVCPSPPARGSLWRFRAAAAVAGRRAGVFQAPVLRLTRRVSGPSSRGRPGRRRWRG